MVQSNIVWTPSEDKEFEAGWRMGDRYAGDQNAAAAFFKDTLSQAKYFTVDKKPIKQWFYWAAALQHRKAAIQSTIPLELRHRAGIRYLGGNAGPAGQTSGKTADKLAASHRRPR